MIESFSAPGKLYYMRGENVAVVRTGHQLSFGSSLINSNLLSHLNKQKKRGSITSFNMKTPYFVGKTSYNWY